MTASLTRPTAFISYAHDDDTHIERVRQFYHFLCANGIDANCDLPEDETPRDWAEWTRSQIENSNFVLVVASPKYKERAEEKGPPTEGRGVRWEAMVLRSMLYDEVQTARLRVLAVVLPGTSAKDLPYWLPSSCTRYDISGLTVAGAEKLLRYLLGKPRNLSALPGPAPALPPRPAP